MSAFATFFARLAEASFSRKEFLIMASSNTPARAPERLPETNTTPRSTWPRLEKKTTRFVIKIGGVIPT
jgi:hypothetical protein